MSDAIPTRITEGGTAKMRLAGNVKSPTGSHSVIDQTEEEDAPIPAAGVVTSALRAGEALVDVGAAVSRSAGRRPRRASDDGSPPRGMPVWLVAALAVMGGGGSHVGLRSLLGPDPEVVSLAARMDAMDTAKTQLATRIDAAEAAIAEAEVTRVTEVRHLIKLNQVVLAKLGVADEDMPDLPPELSERYRDIEVEATRRKLFPTVAPSPTDPGTIPTP